MNKSEVVEVHKNPITISIDNTDYADINGLKIGDEVKISAIGRVRRLSEDKDFTDNGVEKKRKVYSASLELSDLEFDNISDEDRKESEADGLKVSDYKKIKAMKEKVNKIKNGE